MICLSPSGITNLVDKLSEDYDVEVKFWMDGMKESLEVRGDSVSKLPSIFPVTPKDVYTDSEDDEESISPPPFSPLSFSGGSDSDLDEELPPEYCAGADSEVSNNGPELLLDGNNGEGTVETAHQPANWKGFKLVGDNIDKNVRASFQ